MGTEYQVLNCYTKETITAIDNSTAKTLTAATYDDGRTKPLEAVVTIEDSAIRWWCNSSAPVATTQGHLVPAGGSITLKGTHDIENFKIISDTSTDAKIQVSYFRNY
jgi:hypothetical protein